MISCAVASYATASGAETSAQEYSLDIPHKPVAAMLQDLSIQTGIGVSLMVDDASQRNVLVGPLKGRYTVDAALTELLANSDLTYTRVSTGMVVVTARNSSGAGGANTTAQAKAKVHRLADAQFVTTPAEPGAAPPAAAAGGTGSVDADTRRSGVGKVMEEVFVTAQKRQERAIDVPISIVAMSADELQSRKIANIDDLALAVPGLAVQSAGAWNRRISLRGISNVFGTSSLIGLYLDEASVTSGADLQLDLRTYDLERVEVLRGPQGTLYGEGSAGGTIRFITHDPELDHTSMKADVTALFTEDGAPGQRVEGVVNLPVVEDKFALRIAGTYDHQGGWIDQPTAGREDINDQNAANVRVKGLWKPSRDFTVSAMAVIHRNDATTSTGEDDNGNYRQVFNLTSKPKVQDDYNLYNLVLAYDLPAVRILSTSTYLEQDKQQRDYGYRLPTAPPPAIPADVLKPLYTREAEIFTQELRASSSGDSALRWTVGSYYRHSQIDNLNTFYYAVPGPPGTPLPSTLFRDVRNSLSKAWAVFGDASYEFAERFTVGAGLRYYHDDQEYQTATFQEGSFHATNPRVYAQLKITDNLNTYASVAKGFRSGGFNALNQPSYDAESVWSYELGTKMSVWDRRLNLDVAVFYSDYEDYQINGIAPPPAPPLSITSNAGNAEIQGIEFSAILNPGGGWQLSLSGDYLDTEFVEIKSTNSSYAEGDRLDLFPKYRFSAAVRKDFTVGGRDGSTRLDYSEQGRMSFRNRRSGPWYFSESDVINTLNFNTSLQWSDYLSFGIFAQNLLNDRGYLDPFSIEQTAARSRPRSYGVQFGVTF